MSRRVAIGLGVALVATAGVLLVANRFRTTDVEEPESVVLLEVDLADLTRQGDVLMLQGSTEPFSGYMVERYADGEYKTRSRIEDGRLHGWVRGWFPDGTLESEEHFQQGISHGVRKRWHENGTLASHTEIVEGVVHGEFKTWDAEGNLVQRMHMVEGQAHGVSEAYYPSGHLRARVRIEHGEILSQESWDDWVMR